VYVQYSLSFPRSLGRQNAYRVTRETVDIKNLIWRGYWSFTGAAILAGDVIGGSTRILSTFSHGNAIFLLIWSIWPCFEGLIVYLWDILILGAWNCCRNTWILYSAHHVLGAFHLRRPAPVTWPARRKCKWEELLTVGIGKRRYMGRRLAEEHCIWGRPSSSLVSSCTPLGSALLYYSVKWNMEIKGFYFILGCNTLKEVWSHLNSFQQ